MDLKSFLNDALHAYHKKEHLSSDPLEFVHRYKDPMDQEAVALVAALLAYGNVKQIRRSVENALRRIGTVAGSPSEFVKNLGRTGGAKRAAARALQGFVHRFNTGEDLMVLLGLLNRSWKKYGSLGARFVSNLKDDDSNIGPALSYLISDWKSEAGAGGGPFFYHFLTSPKDGSCCKRWCMFLRWMGRKDEVDPGLWSEHGALAGTFPRGRALSAKQLVMPLDTHTGRISFKLGLTKRKNVNWRAALEVTEALKAFDPVDPVSYDFALARIGILDLYKLHGI